MGKLIITCPCCESEIAVSLDISVKRVVDCQLSLFKKKEAVYQTHHAEYVRDSWPHAIQ